MIRIALCDDNKEELNQIRDNIEQYKKTKNISEEIFVSCYSVSSQIWYELQDRDIADIFILDVSMPEVNGFEIAEKIRTFLPKAVILFLTAHSEYADKGYKVNALRYINKLNIARDLPEALDAAISKSQHAKNSYIYIKHAGNCWYVAYDDIKYVRRVIRQLEVCTETENIKSNEGLHEFYQRLNDPRFAFIERSCFVFLG